ncbi:MAG: Unknown protein [uncultured Sulfurovum sp.]|uniref:DUF4412 domain-containing protein n=1 Tax=uncultured Sulfurovum sp. TaxID=269237 RepID=A0A6S6TLN2_9BACT|nr:MAG: Unknown protein [uncultured Sulfurovum sp.]
MRTVKYFKHIVLLSTLSILYAGCGESQEISETSVGKSEIHLQKSKQEPFIKKYALKSGEIDYEIIGSMDMMGSTSKTTGTKKLIFSEYGSHELTELKKIEEQNMMGEKRTLKTHTLDYMKEASLYKVDFNKKNIQRMQVPALAMMMGTGEENMLEKGQKMLESMGGKKLGTDKVLGYECEIWSLMGSKQCLYKGIPLKVETDIMGVTNLEVATKIEFDKSIDKTVYKLPEFPIVNALNRTNIDKSKLADMDAQDKRNAIENAKRMAQLGETLKEGQKKIEANPNMSQEEQKNMMIEVISNSKGMQSQLEKQKAMMPNVISLMKFYRDCLQDANSKSDAQACDKKGQALAKKLGMEEEFDDEEEEEDTRAWTQEGRATIVNEMNEEIKTIENTLPCIHKAKTMIDLMHCNQ